MMILATLVATAPLPSNLGPAWATFTRDPQHRAYEETVEVGTLGVNPANRQLDYWMRRTVITLQGTQVSWTESRTCLAVRSTIAGMSAIRIPGIHTPESKVPSLLYLDGTLYNLTAPSLEGRIEFNGNIGSSLGDFIDASLLALERCWGDTIPKRW